MKVIASNNTSQSARIHFWRRTKNDLRLDNLDIPHSGGEIVIDVEDDQMALVTEQCRVLGVSLREGTI